MTPCRNAVLALFFSSAASVGFACAPAAPSAAAAPAAGPSPSASPSAATKVAAGPRIVGTVSRQGKEWKGGGVVYLEDAPKEPGVAMSATIDVHNKEFTPFIAVITTGGTVTFGNMDALTHHVFSPDVPSWDTGYLKKGENTAARRFDSPGPVALLCNIHPEMLGYVLVVPSTYFGQVGSDGKYVVAGAPPGTYKATAWAPRMATVTQPVTVGSSGSFTANFDLPTAVSTK